MLSVENKLKFELKDYVVIDIENPNVNANSICSIAFIQVKDNKIIKNNYCLINPEDYFPSRKIIILKLTINTP